MGFSRALQHHSSKASILQCSAFFMVQLLYPYMTTGKIISSVQSLSRVWLLATLWTAAHQASLSITNSWSCTNSRPSSQWCHPTISIPVIPFSTLWKNHSFDYMDFGGQSDVSLFTTLSRFVIAFLPRSKHLLISWLQSPCSMILEFKKRKFVTDATFPPSFVMKQWDWMPWP